MSKIVKFKDLEIGKYYRHGASCVRVDDRDAFEELVGVQVINFKNHSEIWNDTDLISYYMTDDEFEEITKEEFEQKLQEAQEEFVKICNRVKNQDNEKATE